MHRWFPPPVRVVALVCLVPRLCMLRKHAYPLPPCVVCAVCYVCCVCCVLRAFLAV